MSRLHGREISRDGSRLQSRLSDAFRVDFARLTVGAPLPAGQLPGGGAYTQALGANQTEETVRISASGTIARWTYVANTPRIGVAPDGRVCLMRSPPRTNITPRNLQLHAAYWTTQVNVTTEADALVAPDGTTTAERVTDNTTSGVHALALATGSVSNVKHAVSVFMKQGTLRYAGARFSSTSGHELTVDLQTKAATASVGASDWILDGVAGGWIRASFVCTPNAGVTSSQIYLSSTGGVYGVYAGATTNVGVWGYQAEPGGYPTDLIPTAGTTAGRAGSRAYYALSSVVRAGRLSYVQDVSPLGAATQYDGDGAEVMLWYIDANTNAKMTTATRVLTVTVNGVARVAAVPLGWSWANGMRIYWGVGAGALKVRYALSTDGGVTWSLPFDPFGGVVHTDAALSTASTTFDTCSDGAGKYWGVGEVGHERVDVVPAWVLQWLPTDDAAVRHWFRPDGAITTASGDVSAWGDQGAAQKGLSQGTAGQRPLYVASGGPFGGLEHLSFTAANNDELVGAAVADWKFLHDGTGMFAAIRFRPTGSGYQAFLSTAGFNSSNVGLTLAWDSTAGGFVQLIVADSSGGAYEVNIQTANGSAAANTPHTVILWFKDGASTEVSLEIDGGTPVTASYPTVPSAANPTHALHVGGRPGAAANDFQGEIADIVIGTDVPSASLLAALRTFMTRAA